MSIFSRVLRKIKSNKQTTPCKLTIDGGNTTVFSSGTTVLQAIQKLDLDINYYCGGTCSCGTCHVKIVAGKENLSKPSARETMVLGYEKSNAGHRLACQARLIGDVEIIIPEW